MPQRSKKKRSKVSRSIRNIVRPAPKTTWILVLQRTQAKLVAHDGTSKKLTMVKGFVNPAGKMQTRELVSDRPGRSYRTAGGRVSKQVVSRAEDAHEHALTEFANGLAASVEKGIKQGDCDRVILAAEPHCLGKIKKALSAQARKRVCGTVSKDLFRLGSKELYAKLAARL